MDEHAQNPKGLAICNYARKHMTIALFTCQFRHLDCNYKAFAAISFKKLYKISHVYRIILPPACGILIQKSKIADMFHHYHQTLIFVWWLKRGIISTISHI